MPTKNTTKKVENNGYSKITSKAPDMENSTEVLFVPKPMKKKLTPHKPPAPKKPKAAKEGDEREVLAPEAVAAELEAAEEAVEVVEPDIKETSEKVEEVAVKSAVIGAISEETLDAVSPASERGAYVNLGQNMPVHLL
jgi:hypothetical protein